jgi:hypothetical protein
VELLCTRIQKQNAIIMRVDKEAIVDKGRAD